jgi:hypothetical protein
MGSTLGPNSGPRAGVILTHPNSFPFLFVGEFLARIILRSDNFSPDDSSPENSSLKICFFPEVDDSSSNHSSSEYFFPDNH